jgi:hypothetical protein
MSSTASSVCPKIGRIPITGEDILRELALLQMASPAVVESNRHELGRVPITGEDILRELALLQMASPAVVESNRHELGRLPITALDILRELEILKEQYSNPIGPETACAAPEA